MIVGGELDNHMISFNSNTLASYTITTTLHMQNTFQFQFSICSSVSMFSRSDYKRFKPGFLNFFPTM